MAMSYDELLKLYEAVELTNLIKLLESGQPSLATSGGVLIGTAREKFRDEFLTLNTDNWSIYDNSGGTIIASVAGNAGGSRYLNLNSGITNNADYYLISKPTFLMPFKLVVGASMSQRIAGSLFEIGTVEVDDNGNIVPETSQFTGPNCLDARNAAIMSFQGASTTNSYYTIRAQGVSELFSAAVSFGTTHMSATGTTPNFIASNQFELLMKTELVNITTRPVNSTSSGTIVLNRTDYCPNPDRKYAIIIRVRNTSVPASATDCRVHFVRVVDASAVAVDFSVIGGNTTSLMAAPMYVTGGTVSVSTATLSPSASYGTSTYNHLISAATTNAVSVKASAGTINEITLTNNGASAAYFKLYNRASAPTVGTDTPIKTIMIPAGQTIPLNFGAYGVRCSTGIAYAVTGGIAISDTTAVSASQVAVSMSYT